MKSKLSSFTLLYHTATDIPAPHSFHVLITLELMQDGSASARFRQEFTDREEIPKEEIEAEGFTENDDFDWEGTLPGFWWEDLNFRIEKTGWREHGQTQVLLQDPEGQNWLSPVDDEPWVLFMEELIQACLEKGGKELPMEMTLGKLEKNNFFEKVRLEWFFSRKEVTASIPGSKQAFFSGLDWSESQKQLKNWIETEAESADLYQYPKSKGFYWLMNDEIWLPYRKGQKGKIWEWVDARSGS